MHGDHYVATLDARYPDLAYEPFVEGGGRGRWKWDQKRPRFIGEDFFATGINPADYAMWGGEVAFQGKAATRDAMAICYRMLHGRLPLGRPLRRLALLARRRRRPGASGSPTPRAPSSSASGTGPSASGQKVKRTFGVFNDTQYP